MERISYQLRKLQKLGITRCVQVCCSEGNILDFGNYEEKRRSEVTLENMQMHKNVSQSQHEVLFIVQLT